MERLGDRLLTRITLPVKIVARIAVAFQIQPRLFTRRAVGEWNVIVSNLVEEVDIRPVEKKSGRNGMNRSIPPSLIEKATIFVERSEVVDIRIGPQPLQTPNFKVGPLDNNVRSDIKKNFGETHKMAFVVSLATIVTQEVH